MKLASLLILLSLGLLFAACTAAKQPRADAATQTATTTQITESAPSTLPPTYTPQAASTSLAKQPGVADRPNPAVTTTLATPTPPGNIVLLPTSTPPHIAEGLPTPPTAIPTAVATIAAPAAVTNIVLAGNDVPWPQGGRTDALLIVSINRESKKVAILSLPRDLYVYIPGWTMNRINLALPHGHGVDYPGGGGGLLADTIAYNFGLSVDHYARIGFDSFTQFVDTLGGIEVVVNCPITDWRLKSPDLDPTVEENWERFTLEPGIHQMDGDLALWYARSRRSTSDFDRGRRQQQLIRAMLAKGVNLGLVNEIPDLWNTFRESVETDLSLPEIIALAALAPSVNNNGIQHLILPADALRAWRVPITGEAVQLLQWDSAKDTFEQLLQPPILNRGERPPLTVVVVTDDDVHYRLAAENLNWHGMQAVQQAGEGKPPAETQIRYHHSTLKGSFHWLVAWLFGRQPEDVVLSQDTNGPYDYQVVLGRDFNPCLPDPLPPADFYTGQSQTGP